MTDELRFGRRLPLPSTRQIIHELRVMAAEDLARQQLSASPSADEASEYGLERNFETKVQSTPAAI